MLRADADVRDVQVGWLGDWLAGFPEAFEVRDDRVVHPVFDRGSVVPAASQPGRSGTWAENPAW